MRRGRASSIGAEYFLTLCTRRRANGLANAPITTSILSEAHRLESEDIWLLRTATVMPDHMHALIVLGAHLDLARALRLFKGRLAPAFRSAGFGWETGYFDHRMRVDDDRLPVFLYIFLNSYRAMLVPPQQRWQGYYCSPVDWTWFEPLTNSTHPFPEWLL